MDDFFDTDFNFSNNQGFFSKSDHRTATNRQFSALRTSARSSNDFILIFIENKACEIGMAGYNIKNGEIIIS